jgi:hypothetical protein
MFTLNSDFKKIMIRTFYLLGIFLIIFSSLFIYFRDFSVAYPALSKKSQVLLKKYPNAKIIIAGDSVAETGMNPEIISPGNGVNIAAPASGIQGFYKALNLYHHAPLTKENIIILNIGFLNFNDEVISNNHFIGQIDGFLDVGVLYLVQQWKKQFFKNVFEVFRCTLSTCPYLSEDLYVDLEKSVDRGFIPSQFPPGKHNTLNDKKVIFTNFESYYKNINLEGVLFDGYKKYLSLLTNSPANIIIVFSPPMLELKNYIINYGALSKVQSFLTNAKAECEQYSNCHFFDYLIEWDHSKLIGNDDINYFDYVHFTRTGGNNFSKILKKDIELTLGRKL